MDANLVQTARNLLRSIRAGMLATLDNNDGNPFGSLVTVATSHAGQPILLMSSLSAHTQYLEHDARCSLLLARQGKGDPLAHPRLTVTGCARKLEDEERALARERFLNRHPKAALYADFGDFSFWQIDVARFHFNGGFGKAADFQASEILLDIQNAHKLLENEADILEHLNSDHSGTSSVLAVHFAKKVQGNWQVSGLDSEGLDLMAGDETARICFRQTILNPQDLRACLIDMAAKARSAS